jgi:hypothetical protein
MGMKPGLDVTIAPTVPVEESTVSDALSGLKKRTKKGSGGQVDITG